ncbi:MAG TPA: FAD-dependent oxidoreductase [Gemmatimonadales bacterium]
MKMISRRGLVAGVTSAAASMAFGSACARAISTTGPARRRRSLAPVRVSPELVIREVAGLRPFRSSGFRVEPEPLGEKVVIHNYGHGGGGVSISWGSAHLAVQHALATPHRRAAVLGCGALGLATARLLQDRGFEVTIYARDLPPGTTSNVAGAQWAPTSLVEPEKVTPVFREQYLQAARFAFRYFQTLVGPRYGIRWMENYFLGRVAFGELDWEFETLFAEILRPETLRRDEHPFRVPFVQRFLSMHIDTNHYLRAVVEDFRLAGGTIEVREFSDPNSIAALAERVILNCTGLGAATLFGDADLIPMKGQLVVLAPQPEVDYITVGPGPGVMYMMPRQDGVILGGTFQAGEWSLEPDPAERDRILRSQRELFDRMS